MNRNRRTVLYGAVVGTLGFLSGCIGSPNAPADDSSSTDSNGASSSVTGTMTTDIAETASRTDRTASPTVAGKATAQSTAPKTAPAGPATVEITTRTGPLTIIEINANPPRNDRQKLFQETIVFKNAGDQQYDISGYTVKYSGTERTYTFSKNPMKTVLPAGQTFRLNTGTSGQTIMPAQYETFAGFDEPILSNDGGTITVTDANGNIVLEATYSAE